MLNGDVQEFVDGLYYGDGRNFVYDDMEFFIQGWHIKGFCYLVLELFVPFHKATYWECLSKDNQECVNKFLEAKIFKGKSFWEVEKNITWIDCETNDVKKATEEYYKKHPDEKSFLEEKEKNYQPIKLSSLPNEEKEEAIKLGYATLKNGELCDEDGNVALALDYFDWYNEKFTNQKNSD